MKQKAILQQAVLKASAWNKESETWCWNNFKVTSVSILYKITYYPWTIDKKWGKIRKSCYQAEITQVS